MASSTSKDDYATNAFDFSPVKTDKTDEAPVIAAPTKILDIPDGVESEPGMIQPQKSNNRAVVLRYIHETKVICYGQLAYVKNTANIVTVKLVISTRGKDDPYMCLEIRFPRDADPPATLSKPSHHLVKVKFMPKKYEVDGHMVTDEKEKAEFLDSLPENLHLKANEAISKQMLIRVNFSFQDKALELVGHPWAWYETTDADVKAKFDGLRDINQCKTLSIYAWHWREMAANFDFLHNCQQSFDFPISHWYLQEKKGPAAYVQWGKIKALPPSSPAFERKLFFHDYGDYNLIVGNGIAYEAQLEINAMNKIRNLPIKMSVLQIPNLDDRGYMFFLQIPEFETIQKTIETARQGLITFGPFHPGNVEDLKPGEKPERDNPRGWNVYFQTDTMIQHGTDVMALGIRPEDPNNPFIDLEMPAAVSLDDALPSQIVYLKLYPSIDIPKLHLKTLDNLRFRHTRSDVKAEMMRNMLIGRYVKRYHSDDLMETFDDEEISAILTGLTPSQTALFSVYLRNMVNGVALCEGPFGTGKTEIIKVLAQIMAKDKKRMLCVTSRNTGCDHIVECLKRWKDDLFCVRLHAMGLKGKSITQHARQGLKASLLPADPEPDVFPDDDMAKEVPIGDEGAEEPLLIGTANVPEGQATQESEPLPAGDEGADEEEQCGTSEGPADEEEKGWGLPEVPSDGWIHDDIVIQYTQQLMMTAEQKWNDRAKSTNPRDPRTILTESALWTYILKHIGVIPSGDLTVTASGRSASLYQKSKVQLLNNSEQKEFREDLLAIGREITNQARVIVCTPAQLASPLMANIDFDLGFIDEATTMNEAEFIMVWRVCRNVLSVGDTKQLNGTVMSKTAENPFFRQLEVSAFNRFIDMGWGYHTLVESMRMTKGLMDLPNHLFYGDSLISGPGTDLQDREITRKWRALASVLFPHLLPEPNGLTYPVFVDVPGTCEPPSVGALSFHNLHNVAVTWSLIDSIIDARVATTDDIGICCPYAAQVSAHVRVLRARGGHFRNVRVGTVDFWHGREAFVMISDAVRSKNDKGNLGFFSKPKRINVWMSRCQHVQILIGNTECVNPPKVDDKVADDKTSRKLEGQNKYLIKMFKWLEAKGRIARWSLQDIPKTDVDWSEPEKETAVGRVAGSSGDAGGGAGGGDGWVNTDENNTADVEW